MNRTNRQREVASTSRQNRINNRQARSWQDIIWLEPALVIGLVLLTLIVDGINMFHYPTLVRLNDEGIYMEQAWSVLRMAKLSPYTYWYDHVPGGWILMAIWMALVGGPHAFGAAIDTGRTLMLLLHLVGVPLLYYSARKLHLSIPLAGLAALLFSLSPLAITYQRMVLLDNIMVFWLLVSLALLLFARGRVLYTSLSGLAFGLALLSKEPAIFMLPVYAYLLVVQVINRRNAAERSSAARSPINSVLPSTGDGGSEAAAGVYPGPTGTGSVPIPDQPAPIIRPARPARFKAADVSWPGSLANELVSQVLAWVIPMVLIVSLYPLYAALRGELFPLTWFGIAPPPNSQTGVFKSGHVNLIEALIWQLSRQGGSFWDPNSMFWQQLRDNWLPEDSILVVVGFLATAINFVRGFFNWRVMAIALLGAIPILYLAHGGEVFDFYIIFAIPFLAMNIAALIDWPVSHLMSFNRASLVAGGVALVLLFFYTATDKLPMVFRGGPDTPTRQALAWIEGNVDPNAKLVIPDNIWVDLHEPVNGKPGFVNAHSYWKVNSDSQVQYGVFNNDWHNVDYVILFPGMREDFKNAGINIAQWALDNSSQIQRWVYSDVFVEVWKVNK